MDPRLIGQTLIALDYEGGLYHHGETHAHFRDDSKIQTYNQRIMTHRNLTTCLPFDTRTLHEECQTLTTDLQMRSGHDLWFSSILCL